MKTIACQNQLIFLSIASAFIVMPNASYGQSLPNTDPPSISVQKLLNTLSVTYIGACASQERAISRQSTVMYGVGAHYSFYSSDSPPLFGSRFINEVDKYFGRSYATHAVTPYIFTEIRLYTNLDKRSVRGGDTRANCANYFALVGELPFATGNLINVPNLALAYPVGVKYGVRRPLGSKVYVEGSIGGFLKISRVQQTLQPRLDFAIGWHP